ncbi:MAG: hypothetical protein ABS901_07690, partial [Candidatus Limivicinus sp.]
MKNKNLLIIGVIVAALVICLAVGISSCGKKTSEVPVATESAAPEASPEATPEPAASATPEPSA